MVESPTQRRLQTLGACGAARSPIRFVVTSLIVLAAMVGDGWTAQTGSVPDPVTFVLVGDTGGAGLEVSKALQERLGFIAELVGGDGVLVLNLEGALQEDDAPPSRCRPRPGSSVFRIPAGFADLLAPIADTVVTMANNHAMDCGADGVADTVRVLARRNIRTVGAGGSLADACTPLQLTIGELSVGFAAYLVMEPGPASAGPTSAGAASWHDCAPLETLARLSQENDLVIASLHFHLRRGWPRQAPPEHLRIVEAALDAGADVVVGHGPHVLHGVTVHSGGIGLLSLGNFVLGTGYNNPPEAQRSVAARLQVSDSGLAIELVPLFLDDDGWPRPAPAGDAGLILGQIETASRRLGTSLSIVDNRAVVRVER
jgi:hypothetical protein